MKRLKVTGSLLGVLLALVLVLQGCAALVVGAGAGAAAVVYVRGDLETSYPNSLSKTYDATLKAMDDLGIKVFNSSKDALGGIVEATKSDGTKVKITLSPKGPEVTEVKIRIGLVGDEEGSKAIQRQISKRLGK